MYAPADEETRARMQDALVKAACFFGVARGEGPLAWGWQGCTIGRRTGNLWLRVASKKEFEPLPGITRLYGRGQTRTRRLTQAGHAHKDAAFPRQPARSAPAGERPRPERRR